MEKVENLKNIVAIYGENIIVWSKNSKQHKIVYGEDAKLYLSEAHAAQAFASCLYNYVKSEGLLD